MPGLSHFRFRQFFQHAVTQSRRAGAAAGKSEHQQQVVGIRRECSILKTVTCPNVRRSQGRIDRIMGAAVAKQHEHQEE